MVCMFGVVCTCGVCLVLCVHVVGGCEWRAYLSIILYVCMWHICVCGFYVFIFCYVFVLCLFSVQRTHTYKTSIK